MKNNSIAVSTFSLHMQRDDHLLFGGRRIKTLLESLVERPLNRWIFDRYPDLTALNGRTLAIALTPEGTLVVS
ncbi:hypothetical protein [Trichothermofontia sp.]